MNKIVPIEEAKERLAELAEAVGAGESVVVTRDGVPVFDLVPHQGAPEEAPAKGGINWQAIEDYKKAHGIERIFDWDPATFDDPIPEEEFLELFEPGT